MTKPPGNGPIPRAALETDVSKHLEQFDALDFIELAAASEGKVGVLMFTAW